MFLTVDATTHSVRATEEVENASIFYIYPDEEGNHPYEFIIGYFGDGLSALKRTASTLTPVQNETVRPLPRFMSAPVNTLGYNGGPLQLHFTASHSSSRLTLHSRLVKQYVPTDISNWVNGKEAFFLNCARRFLKRDGFVCVRRQQRGNHRSLTTACVPAKSFHNETSTWMLFRLHHPSIRERSRVVRPPSRNPDSDDLKHHKELRELDDALEGMQVRTKLPSGDAETDRSLLLPERDRQSGATAAVDIDGSPIKIVTFETGF